MVSELALSVLKAKAEHAKALAKLIYSSEPTLLSYLFGGKDQTLNFIEYACAQEDGQFSASRHYAHPDGQAICTLWHSNMPDEFEKQTLASLQNYFTVQQLGHLIINKNALDACFLPPSSSELCIGHIAVSTEARGKGYATDLLNFARKKAAEMGKESLILDVEKSNQAALNCYLKNGFTLMKENPFFATEQTFLRMSLRL